MAIDGWYLESGEEPYLYWLVMDNIAWSPFYSGEMWWEMVYNQQMDHIGCAWPLMVNSGY